MSSVAVRWGLYIILAVVTLRSLSTGKTEIRGHRDIHTWFLVTAGVFSVSSLFQRWSGISHEGRAFVERPVELGLLIILIGTFVTSIAVTHRIWNGFSSKQIVQLLVVVAILVLSLFNSRIGDEALRDGVRPLTFLSFFTFLMALFTQAHTIEEPCRSSRPKVLSLGILISISLVFSLRIDGVKADGAWYHVSYFTGVVKSLRNGGILLWDTPSQYGFLNLQLASMLPIRDPQVAFFTFQAALLLLVSAVVVVTFWSTAPTRLHFALFGLSFILLLNFADPALVGPQPFPSSSVMRFGPSAIVLSIIYLWDERLRTSESTKAELSLAFVIGLAGLWSFESLFYVFLILVGWTIGNLRQDLRIDKSTMRVLSRSLLVILGLVSFYSIFVAVAVGRLPEWEWFVLAASKFAGGFGALPLDPSGAIWILILTVVSCVILARVGAFESRRLFGASIGALIGWSSYFVGRSHSSNVIAIFPLIFLAAVLALFAARQMYKEANDGSENCRIPLRHALGVFQVGVAVCTSVVISGILANQSMPNLVNSFRTLGTKVIFEDGASPSDSLINFLDQADASRLPIAYQGNLAVLPKLPRQFGAKFDLAGSWLPEPLALLEEPIPPAVRQEVLQRWFDREHRDGYFLWDKINSIPGRASSWLDVIGQTHDCKIVSETSEWQLSHCRARGS